MRKTFLFGTLFGVLLSLLFAGNVWAATIDVSQPANITDQGGYDRNPSIIYDGTNYWLFYAKGDNGGVRGEAGYNPDGDTYVIYYKTAASIDGLIAATETKLALSETSRPANFTQRVVSATYFDGNIYAFVSSGQDGTDRGLYYYMFNGTTWSGPTQLIADATARGGHVNVTSDANRVYIVWESSDGSSDCYTWDGTTLGIKVDISDGNQPKINLFTGTKDVGVLYVVNIEDGTGDIEVFQAATDPIPGFGPHSTAIPGGGLYDPCIFDDGINLYVVSAPYVAVDRQYMIQTKAVGTSTTWAPPKTVSYGGHRNVEWWDYWPCGFYDGSDAYIFFTTETEGGPYFSDGEIAYIKMDWDLSNDHYFYIQNGVDNALAGDFVNVAPGIYREYVYITSDDITVQGAGIDQSIIDLDGLIPFWEYGMLSSSFSGRGGVLFSGYGNTEGEANLVENVSFNGFTVKNAGENYPGISGTHTGANDAAVLTDASASWATDELVGQWIVNASDYTDNSGGRQFFRAQITANTATTVTMSYISGGSDMDWDNGDIYVITPYREWYDEELDGRDDVRGMIVASGRDITIADCKVEQCGASGITSSRSRISPRTPSQDIEISGCTITHNQGNGISTGDTYSTITITGNIVSNNSQPVGAIPPKDLYDHVSGMHIGGRSETQTLSGVISGNTVSDNAYQGITVYKYTDGFLVENNTVTGHNLNDEGAGIFVTTGWGFTKVCKNHTVQNNIVTGNIRGIVTYFAWGDNPGDFKITGNTITTDAGAFETGQAAIKIDNSYNLEVKNNTISCDGVGIRLHSGDTHDNLITGNTIDGAMYAGVYITSGAHENTFTENTIKNTIEDTFTQYADWGSHTGADDQTILVDANQSWATDALVGFTLINLTDGSNGIITANDATTVTATLAGGTENDWDTSDDYDITFEDIQADGVVLRGGSSKINLHAGTGNVFHSNGIFDNNGDGFDGQLTTETVDASANWWGSIDPDVVKAAINGTVDYTPWLVTGTELSPGFQADYSELWVDDNSPQTGTIERVQEGVNLVTGSIVNLAPGVYEEQVVIDKALDLIGSGIDVSTIQSPSTLTDYFTTSADNYPIVYIHDAVDVNLEELTVDGLGRGNKNSRFVGIGFWNAGGNLTNVHLTGVRDTPFSGAQHGVSVYAYNDTGGPYTINIDGTNVDDMQKTGIAMGGDDLTANISNTTVTGQGATTITAQNGIQISHGAGGTISDCTISDIAYTGGSWIASGMLLYLGTNVDVNGTCVINNSQANIVYQGTDGSVDGAVITTGGVVSEEGVSIRDYGTNKSGGTELGYLPVSPLDGNWDLPLGAKGAPTSVSLSNLTLTGVDETDSYGIAAWSLGDNVTVTVDDCDINNWDIGIVAYESGSVVDLTAASNNISGNAMGFWTNAATAQNAECNYWGHLSGPYHDPNNLFGLGNEVSDNVDFEPWDNESFSSCSYNTHPLEVWVDDDYTLGGANDGHIWSYDAFDNISDAITQVGETGLVHVLNGLYSEQVVINKSLTVAGSDNPVIEPPGGGLSAYTLEESGNTFYPIIIAYGGDIDSTNYISGSGTIAITISGLNIDGNDLATVNGYTGMLIRNCTTSEVSNNNVYELLMASGNPITLGIVVYGNSDILVSGNTIDNWTRVGIGILGDGNALPDPTANVTGNTIIGRGPLPSGNWAQNGIQVSGAAFGNLTNNEVYDIAYIPTDWAASAINIYQAADGMTVSGNNVHNSEAALYSSYTNNLTISNNNTFNQNEFIFILGGDNISFTENTLTDNDQGLYIGDATNVMVTNNTFTGNDYAILADGVAANLTFTGNNITTSTTCGIYLDEYSGDEPTGVVIFNNNISGNTYGLNNLTTVLTDASGNWWGDQSGPTNVTKVAVGLVDRPMSSNALDGKALKRVGKGTTIGNGVTNNSTDKSGTGDAVSTNVDFSPWLAGGADASGDPGFQGDFSDLWVDDDSPVSGSLPYIAEGLDLVTGSVPIVNVSSGTYPENVSLAISFNNGTLNGDNTSLPLLTGGLRFDDLTTGMTVSNLHLTGTVIGKNSVVRLFGAVTDLTLNNCIIDGENISGRHGFSGGGLYGNIIVSNCEFKDVLGWALFETRSGSGGGGTPLGIVNFFGNHIHECNGSVAFRGDETDWTDVVNIYENTWENIGNNGGEQGQQWAAFEVNRAEDVNVYDNTVDNVDEGEWAEGEAAQFWAVTDLDVHDNTFINCYQGIWIYGDNGNLAVPGGSISNNTISDNDQYGIMVDPTATAGPLDATCNWWGSSTGPYNATTNPLGLGNAVSDNVTYEPWNNSVFTNCSYFVDRDTVWVKETYGAIGSNDGHTWGYDAFNNVQDGVDAVREGGVVIVHTGNYIQQVVIAKELELVGDGKEDVTITSPTNLTEYFTTSADNYPVVYVHDVNNVQISGVTIDGNNQGDNNYRFYGIAFWNADGSFSESQVLNVMNSTFSGQQHGVGIYAYNNTGGPYNIALNDVLVNDFQKTAIALNGDGLTVDLDDITTIGEGATDVTAQNGLQIGPGVVGTLDNSSISAVYWTGDTWTASGIIVFGTLVANDVTIDQCQSSIYFQDGSGSFNGLNLTNPTGDGIIAYSTGAKADKQPRVKINPYEDMAAHNLKTPIDVTITNSVIAGTGATDSWGAYTWATGPVNFTITTTIFTGWDYATVPHDDGGGVTSFISGNSFTGCNVAVSTNATNLQDASLNWYGVTDPTNVSAYLDGNIDYTPWFGSGTDTEPGATGFQGDYSLLWVDDDSPQFGTTGRIQEGINLLDDGSKGGTIWVVDGIYFESVNFSGKDAQVGSLLGLDNDSLHIVNTIIDANIDSLGVPNASVATFTNGEAASAGLSGLTLCNGTGTQNPADNNRLTGGAIYCNGSSPTISTCIIHSNTSVRGGGIAAVNSDLTLTNCTIVNNNAVSGSGISCDESSSPTIGNSIIAFCEEGSAVKCLDGSSSPNLSCTDIFGNDGGDWVDCIAGQDTLYENLHKDPQFCDTSMFNYSINDGSPCDSPGGSCGDLIGALNVGCDFPFAICGDANADGNVNVSDAVYIINYVFITGSPAPDPYDAGDANCDGTVNVSDAVWIINYIFIGGYAPCDIDGDGMPDC